MAERFKPQVSIDKLQEICRDCPANEMEFRKYDLPRRICKIAQTENKLKRPPNFSEVSLIQRKFFPGCIPDNCPNGYAIPFDKILVIHRKNGKLIKKSGDSEIVEVP